MPSQGLLLGREREQAHLRALLDEVCGGRGRAVVLEGEAGIGKSALLHDALASVSADWAVAAGRAEELEQRTPLAAVATVVAAAQHADLPGATALAEVLHDARTGVVDAAVAEPDFRVGEAVVAFAESVTVDRPLVLALDDAHWADAFSLRSLLPLTRVLAQLPLVLVLVRRPAAGPHALTALLGTLSRDGATELVLDGLPTGAIQELVTQLVGDPPGPNLERELQAAGGNPLFIGSIVDFMAEAGVLVVADGRAEVDRAIEPPTLPVTITERLRLCSPSTLETLTLAAVTGTSFTPSDLASLAGTTLAEVLPAISEAMRSRIVEERGDQLAFRHDLIRETLYRNLPTSVRNDLHLMLARRLAASEAPPSLVAEHLLRGVTRGDRDTLELLHRTAAALVATAADLAAALLERGIALAVHAPARLEAMQADLAIAVLRAGRIEEGEQACRDAIEHGLASSIGIDLRYALARSLGSRGEVEEARNVTGAGLAAPGLDPGQRAALLALDATMLLLSGQVEDAARRGDEAVADAEAVGDHASLSHALFVVAMAARLRGRLVEALPVARQSTTSAEIAGTFDAHHHVPAITHSVILAELDRVDEALAVCRRALQTIEHFGARDMLAWHHLQLGHLLFLEGSWDDAESEVELALELAEHTGQGWMVQGRFIRALIALHRNDLASATRWRDEADRDLASGTADVAPGITATRRAVVLEAEGEAAAALEHLETAWGFLLEVDLQAELPWVAPDLVRLAAQAGDEGTLDRVAVALDRLAEANPDVPLLDGQRLLARGLARGDVGLLSEAAGAARRSTRPFDKAVVLETAGSGLAGAGRADEGASLLAEAVDLYAELDAARCVARVEAALRSLGVARGRRGQRKRPRSGWEALTTAEVAVARLVAEGLSNREIGARLYVSPRTIQTHVSHALAKLGVASRRELAAIARAHP